MNDRESLEMAAKAAGMDIDLDRYDDAWGFALRRTSTWLNPLNDDGDALRLAVRLNLAVVLHPALNQAIVRPYHTRDMNRECREDCEKHTDHFAATRRAIVRAAAEIGRQMQEGGAA